MLARNIALCGWLILLTISCNRKPSCDLTQSENENAQADTIAIDNNIVDTLDSILPTEIIPDTMISYSRSGCYGTCPVYDFVLMEDGSANINGKAHVKFTGSHSITLNREEMMAFFQLIESTDLSIYNGRHPANFDEWVFDLPTSTLICKMDKQNRIKIVNNHSAPKSYRIFEIAIRQWIEGRQWIRD